MGQECPVRPRLMWFPPSAMASVQAILDSNPCITCILDRGLEQANTAFLLEIAVQNGFTGDLTAASAYAACLACQDEWTLRVIQAGLLIRIVNTYVPPLSIPALLNADPCLNCASEMIRAQVAAINLYNTAVNQGSTKTVQEMFTAAACILCKDPGGVLLLNTVLLSVIADLVGAAPTALIDPCLACLDDSTLSLLTGATIDRLSGTVAPVKLIHVGYSKLGQLNGPDVSVLPNDPLPNFSTAGTITGIYETGVLATFDAYFYLWFADTLNLPVPVSGFKLTSSGFPVSMADSSFGYNSVVNGWPYQPKTVDGLPGKLFRSWNALGTTKITVTGT